MSELTAKEILTKSQYAVFEHRQLLGLSLTQTALALEVSVSTVRSTEREIRRKLREAA